jgi:hypothetical protein
MRYIANRGQAVNGILRLLGPSVQNGGEASFFRQGKETGYMTELFFGATSAFLLPTQFVNWQEDRILFPSWGQKTPPIESQLASMTQRPGRRSRYRLRGWLMMWGKKVDGGRGGGRETSITPFYSELPKNVGLIR